jgi:hypothetical protein
VVDEHLPPTLPDYAIHDVSITTCSKVAQKFFVDEKQHKYPTEHAIANDTFVVI